MGYNQAYNAYQSTNIKTASQGRLIVLLYEAAVKNLKSASTLIDSDGKIKASNIEKFSNLIQKTQAIISELQVSLDMEKGGDIAKNLMSLYLYFNRELTDASINHNKDKVTFVENMMSELLSAWRTASNSTANSSTQMPNSSPSFSIQG